jgi:hypothetical protein
MKKTKIKKVDFPFMSMDGLTIIRHEIVYEEIGDTMNYSNKEKMKQGSKILKLRNEKINKNGTKRNRKTE